MEPNVVDYDLIINESEIFAEERSKEEKVEESMKIFSFLSKNESSMKLILQKLHEYKAKWRSHGRNSPTWGFFFIDDESKVDV
jgi:hypothetical protein